MQKPRKVLALDLGGTKILAAAVDPTGRIYDAVKEPVDFSDGARSLVAQMERLSAPLIRAHGLKTGALASAGPLDPATGELLNATNFKSDGEQWGRIKIIRDLKAKLKIPIKLENDAAAAVLAEYRFGAKKGCPDLMVITLGTGLGVGVIANGALVRSGRGLHPEAGHICIDHTDRDWLCGCGNHGCAEAFLSGTNFTANLARLWGEPRLTGEILLARARQDDEKVLGAFLDYGLRLAAFLYSMCVVFSPQQIVLSGGFSHSHELFLPTTEIKLAELLRTRREGVDMLPRISISSRQDQAGLLGAAVVAFSS